MRWRDALWLDEVSATEPWSDGSPRDIEHLADPGNTMNAPPRQCPKCGSSDVRFDAEHGEASCKNCKFDWLPPSTTADERLPETAETPLKIFLSYGHDEHVADARRIKADLEQRGHTVWFDEERLIPGRDFEQYIEQGLDGCDKVVLLMTPHSVRRPDGYCLNEIAKALERNKLIIPLLLVELEKGPPTSICRIQHLDLRDAVPIREREDRYRQRFHRLVQAIEEDALDFEGGQARLKRWLRPLDDQPLIAPHVARFTGRQWLLQELDDWLEHRPESRVFWVLGGPGIGKSAVAAWLCHQRGEVVASHFCVAGHDDRSDPRRVVFSLAYQLAQHLPSYDQHLQNLALEEEQAKNALTLFDNLILGPLSKSDIPAPNGHQLVVIDAIDEATQQNGNDVADFIARNWAQTPSWLRLVITSRPEPEVVSRLERPDLKPFVVNAQSAENLADLRRYLRTELQKLAPPTEKQILDTILQKSEGIFLYVIAVLEELLQGTLSIDRPNEFPQGMAGYYRQFFDRRFPREADYKTVLRPVLNAVIAQREPLPLDLLAAATGLTDFELRERLQLCGSLFPIHRTQTETDSQETISPFHKSVADWLTARHELTGTLTAGPFAVDLHSGRQALAEACWRRAGPRTGPRTDPRDFLKSLGSVGSGKIVLGTGEPFDKAAERAKITEVVRKLREARFVPGESATCRVF